MFFVVGLTATVATLLIIGKRVYKRSLMAMISYSIYNYFYWLECSDISIRKPNHPQLIQELSSKENLNDKEKAELYRAIVLQELNCRELATIRVADSVFGPLKYNLKALPKDLKPYTKEQIAENLAKMKKISSNAIFALNAGPFNQPDEFPDFTLKGSSVKSFFFNFARNESRKVAILHFHGGAYVTGVGELCYIHERWCSEHKFDLLGLEYTTFPLGEIEGIIEEALRSFKWLVEEKGHSEIYVIGESAGANLCWLLADKLSQLDSSTEGKYMTALKGAILLSPWCDLQMATPELSDLFHQDRLVRNTDLREWKLNGIPCGLGEEERVKQFSPYLWTADQWQRVLSVLPKGMFISYSGRERFSHEIETVIDNLKATSSSVSIQRENIPLHSFHLFIDFLPDHYMRTVTGIVNLINKL